jgi:hypothetical protein
MSHSVFSFLTKRVYYSFSDTVHSKYIIIIIMTLPFCVLTTIYIHRIYLLNNSTVSTIVQ